jgi:hypothetical protein
MRQFVVKILALESSLCIAWNTLVYEDGISGVYDAAGEVAGAIIRYEARNVAKSAVRSSIRDAAKNRTTNEDIVQAVCLSTMNSYAKILEAIDNLGSVIKPKEEMNPMKAARLLITFDDDQLKKLMLMNRRFRLFYFFKVHEIIFSLLPLLPLLPLDIVNDDDRNMLPSEFNQLLKRTGDFDVYNNFFVSDITSDELDKLTNIFRNDFPHDLTKLIVDYCHLSIYNKFDLNFILDKIILSSFSLSKKIIN